MFPSLRSFFPTSACLLALSLTACERPEASRSKRPSEASPTSSQEAEQSPLNADRVSAIILASNATPAERYAAEELQRVLGKLIGKEPVITVADEIPAEIAAEMNFVIGWHPANQALELEKLDEEESLVKITGSTVHLTGGRSRKRVKNKEGLEHPLHERGTLYAVYDFLESLGVRWYRPEPWGEHIPESTGITLKEGEIRTQPVYRYRYGIAHYNTYGYTDEWLERHQLAKVWAIRNRQNANLWRERNLPGVKREQFGGDYVLDFSHAYWRLVPQERYFKTNPEYFALINGERSSDRYAQLCLGNKEVQELVYKEIKQLASQRPHQSIFSLDPNDFTYWCECPLCIAMDEPKTKASYGTGAGGVSMSNRVARFNNIIATRLAKEMPGVGIGYYAYAQHTDPPAAEIRLEPNVYIQPAAYAGTFSDYSRTLYDPKSAPNKRFKAVLDGYKGRVGLMAREYWSFYRWPGPLPIVHTLKDRIRAYHHDYGMNGIYSETHPCWGPQGMSLYFYTWLLRNPDGDVEAEKDLYYRNFYGPAYEPMKAYHEYLEEIGQGGVFYNSGGSNADELITTQNVGKLRAWIDEAKTLTGDREPYARRLMTVAAGQDYSELALEFRTLKAANKIPEAQKKLDEIGAYFQSYPDGSVFDNAPAKPPKENRNLDAALRYYRAEMAGASQMLSLFERPEVTSDLTKTWRFRPVNEEYQPESGWAAAGVNESDWSRVDAGLPWQRQGYPNHHGVGLFRKSVTLPKVVEGHRLVLYFEQIDGHARAYLDGKMIGERKLGPKYEGYQKAWYLDLTDLAASGQKVQLAVEVTKEHFVGGLTKPVYLLDVAAIRPPDE